MPINKSFNNNKETDIGITTGVDKAENSQITQNFYGSESKSKKDQKHLTPLPPINPNFIGREKELNTIEENLKSDNVVCVVNGIGGVGKSELSYAYLHQHKNEYNKIAFIEMTEESGTLEEVFKIKFQDELYLSADDSFDTIIKRLQSFAKPNLLLIDNLLSEDDFKKVKPLNVNFDILITTRAKLNSRNPLTLGTLNPQDAKKLFLSIYDTTEDISTILIYLDRHPLFIRLTAYSLFEEYIELDELKANIKSGAVSDIDSEDDKTFQEHLQETFNKQFQDEKNEDLKVLLQTLALFPAIEIDLEILKKMLGEEKLKPKLQKLVSRGWLTKKENSYKLHQIIKEFMLTQHPIEYEEVVYILENIGNYIDPYDNALIASSLNGYIPIVEALLSRFKEKKDKNIAFILDSLTFLFYSLGEYDNALRMQEELFEIRQKLYNKNSAEIAKSHNLLGVIYGAKGKYEKAEPFYEKALKIREEVLGENHSDTAISYAGLGFLYNSKGEYEKAEPLYKKALKIIEEELGENHHNAATSYNNLATLYESKGEYEKAEPLYKKALKIREEVLGKNHPNTASSYNNFATLYESKGEYEKAEPLFEKALKIREEVLGENHPDTASSYNNLAGLYESKGEYKKAEQLYEKALKIREEVLGENHPDTVNSYWNLGLFYKDRKLCNKAKVLLEKCIEVVEKLDYFEISLIDIKRALKDIEKSLKDEKKVKFNKKGRYCIDS